MYKKFVFSLIIGVILFSSTAAGITINQYRREATISSDDVRLVDTMLFDEMPEQIRIPLMFNINNFESRANFPGHSCVVDEATYGSLITCDLVEGETGRLTLEFISNEMITDIGDYYYYSDTLRPPLETDSLVYNARLKSDYVLIEEDSDLPFRPFTPGDGNKTSDGRRIIVYWSREHPDTDSISPSLTFEEVGTVVENDYTILYMLIFGSFLIFVLFAMTYFSSKESDAEYQEKVYSALKDDERMIMNILQDSEGEIKQKRIVEMVDFSKAKVSRLIRDLKERGLIETKRVGRTNRVLLKKEEE